MENLKKIDFINSKNVKCLCLAKNESSATVSVVSAPTIPPKSGFSGLGSL